jgi:predicted nucleotidyltransferase
MTLEEFFRRIEAHRDELASAGVRRLGVYGSVARGEAGPESDIDVLVEFATTPDLFEFAALRDRLSEIFGRRVDLATPQGLKPRLRARILNEVRYAT